MKVFAVFIIISAALILSEATYRREIKDNQDVMHVELMKKTAPYELEPREGECPIPEDIFPCTCDNLNLFMICDNVTTEEELRSIFSRPFPQDNFDYFIMNQYQIESNITYLGHGIFGTKTFESVSFHNVNFNINIDIFDLMTTTLNSIEFTQAPGLDSFVKDFSSFSALKQIILQYTSIKDYFVRSPSVEFLTLTNSYITEGSENKPLYLGPMPQLNKLWLQNGNLHFMPDISLYPKIYEFYVVNNYISYIGPQSVPNYLDDFHASGNDIQDIDIGSLKVNYGAELWFGFGDSYGNELFYLDEGRWKDILVNASHVILEENPWGCGCEMAWIFGSDPEYTPFLSKLAGTESCANGTLFTDLDRTYYETSCYY